MVSGCEFFKDYKDRDYTAEGLVFNWNQVENAFRVFLCILNNKTSNTLGTSWY